MSHLNPGRRQPYRLGEPRYEELWQPVAFCCSVHRRRPLLLTGDVARVLTDTLLEAAAQHGSAVIAYCICLIMYITSLAWPRKAGICAG